MTENSDSSPAVLRTRCRRVALGLDPPSLTLKGGRVFSVFSGELFAADVVLCGEVIAGVGRYPESHRGPVVDARGQVIIPGFIDSHVHVESSLLSPARFAEVVAPHGITTAMIEPHELTNVVGTDGVRFFSAAREGLPVDLRIMLPSSVPASPFEQGAVHIDGDEIRGLLTLPGVQGLGEVMDYAAVLRGGDIWGTLEAMATHPVDGHAPDLAGRELAAYLLAGPRTDHETTRPDLLLERRRLGMWLLAREGTAARDFDTILPFLRRHGMERTALCTDDRHAATLVEEHHIDGLVARLVKAGIRLRDAVVSATLAPATLYRLFDRGGVAPGMRGDLLLVEDPAEPHPAVVVSGGRVVVRNGELTVALPDTPPFPRVPVRIPDLAAADLLPAAPPGNLRARAVRVIPGSIHTEEAIVAVTSSGGRLQADPAVDLAYLALLERHRGSGRVGRGLVTGLGLRRGALASTVAHDAHHLIVAGVDPADMLAAVRAVRASNGGLAVAHGDDVRVLPLPLAGLMTDRPAREVATVLRELEEWAAVAGVTLPGPFMALSFLSLTVIPKLRITVDGLLDVEAGTLVPVVVG